MVELVLWRNYATDWLWCLDDEVLVEGTFSNELTKLDGEVLEWMKIHFLSIS